MNKIKFILGIIIFLTISSLMNTTPFAYYKHSFLAENDHYILVHYWSFLGHKDEPVVKNNPFGPENRCNGYFILIDKSNGNMVLKQGSSFFTYGWIDKASEYIVLLSNLSYYDNPKVALFNTKGKLLFKSRFPSTESVLSMTEYSLFKNKYPKFCNFLIKNDGISASDDLKIIYINQLFYVENESLRNFLDQKSKKNHLIDCISGTVTNRLYFWYAQTMIPLKHRPRLDVLGQPDIKLVKNKLGRVIGISLLDVCKNRFTIPITKKNKDGIHVPIK